MWKPRLKEIHGFGTVAAPHGSFPVTAIPSGTEKGLSLTSYFYCPMISLGMLTTLNFSEVGNNQLTHKGASGSYYLRGINKP